MGCTRKCFGCSTDLKIAVDTVSVRNFRRAVDKRPVLLGFAAQTSCNLNENDNVIPTMTSHF